MRERPAGRRGVEDAVPDRLPVRVAPGLRAHDGDGVLEPPAPQRQLAVERHGEGRRLSQDAGAAIGLPVRVSKRSPVQQARTPSSFSDIHMPFGSARAGS